MKATLIACLPLLALASCGKTKNEFAAPPPPDVTVAHPETREVTTYAEFPATITGVSEVNINARVTGILEASYFKEGEQVAQGARLFLIEKAPYVAAVNAAQADLANAQAARQLATAKLTRMEKVKTGAVSEFDVEVARAELAQADAAVAQSQALLDDAEIKLTYTEITAPNAGRMSRALVDVGNLVEGSQATLLATVTDDSEVRVFFELPERAMIDFLDKRAGDGGVKTGELDNVRLTLADGTVHDEPGTIDFIDSRVDPATRTASVRAVFPNPDGRLASGLYGRVGYPLKFPNPRHPDSVLVPATSILRDLAGDFVWALDEDNVVRRRGVETGMTVPRPVSDPNTVPQRDMIILKGLAKEDRVIVSGLQRAREGAKVAPRMAEPGPPPPSPAPEN